MRCHNSDASRYVSSREELRSELGKFKHATTAFFNGRLATTEFLVPGQPAARHESLRGKSMSDDQGLAVHQLGITPPWRWLLAWSLAASVVGLGLLIQSRAAEVETAGSSAPWLFPNDRAETQDPSRPSGVTRMREGMRIEDRNGQFRPGDRWMFVPLDGKGRFTVLENLNLERIARLMAERPDVPAWRVSGRVTEFRGANYLLIEHAVMTGAAPAARSQVMRP